MKSNRSIVSIDKRKHSEKILKMLSSISLIVSSKLKNSPKKTYTLSSIFIVFLKSVPGASTAILPETKLKNTTKMMLDCVNNEDKSWYEYSSEVLGEYAPQVSEKIKEQLDHLSHKAITTSRKIFSKACDKNIAIEKKISIEKEAIKKYKALPIQEQDLPDNLVKLYAKKFAKFCYLVGFEQDTRTIL